MCEPTVRSDIIDDILLDMAVAHPRLSHAEEAALKDRLFAILIAAGRAAYEPGKVARLFREAKSAN